MEIKQIRISDKDFSYVRQISKDVFYTEMGIPNSELFDEYDSISDHFIFVDEKNIVGSVRLHKIGSNMKLERMAIYQEFRGKKFGSNGVLQIVDYYKKKNIEKIILDSIYDIREFYRKCGFTEVGKIFERVNLPHIRMELEL